MIIPVDYVTLFPFFAGWNKKKTTASSALF
jgi:hypothetical protein